MLQNVVLNSLKSPFIILLSSLSQIKGFLPSLTELVAQIEGYGRFLSARYSNVLLGKMLKCW